MKNLFEAARGISSFLDELGFAHAFIGGLAVQIWGQPRLTTDVDLTVFVELGQEHKLIEPLLAHFAGRISNASEHADLFRVLLLKDAQGVSIDIGVAGFPFELELIGRAQVIAFGPDLLLPIISASDLVVMKAFAGRSHDWSDIEGILVRSANQLNWTLIEELLVPLLQLKEEPEQWDHLISLRDQAT